MIQQKLMLKKAEQVRAFVNLVNQYDFDMDLKCGRYVVEAKSLLGIFSLDLSRPLTLEFDDTGADPAKVEQLLNELQQFAP